MKIEDFNVGDKVYIDCEEYAGQGDILNISDIDGTIAVTFTTPQDSDELALTMNLEWLIHHEKIKIDVKQKIVNALTEMMLSPCHHDRHSSKEEKARIGAHEIYNMLLKHGVIYEY